MTQNKFWLVCRHNEQNTPIIEGFFDNLQGAKELADFLSRTQKYQEYYICEATHHFKANVDVVETDLTTLYESLTVEPKHKFKVGDVVNVLHDTNTYKIIKLGINDYGRKYYDLKNVYLSNTEIYEIPEHLITLAEPTTPETPKREFKVGDNVLYQEGIYESGTYWRNGVVIDIINNIWGKKCVKVKGKDYQEIFNYLLDCPMVKPAE